MDSLRERCAQRPLLPQVDLQPQGPPHSTKTRRQHVSPGSLSPPPGRREQQAALWALPLRVLMSRRFLIAVLLVTLLLHCAARLPALWPPPADFSDLASLSGDSAPAGSSLRASPWADDDAAGDGGSSSSSSSPKLIPRILHQTYSSSGRLSPRLRKHMLSWRLFNPSWEVRLYDDQDCLEFVRREYPQYLETYRRLAKAVERADLFRYLVVLRHGGVYADVDTECRQPLNPLIHSTDTLVVGWESDFSIPEQALDAWYVRTRQVAQWVFAAAAGHPALLEAAERIAASVHSRTIFSPDSSIDTQERTGAGLFTDVVLEYAAAHPPAQRDDPWGVRLLPRVVFGAPLQPAYGLAPSDRGVVVLHHQLGAWRLRSHRHWFWQRQQASAGADGEGSSSTGTGGSSSSLAEAEDSSALAAAAHWRRPSKEARKLQLERMHAIDARHCLCPVSASFSPPFDLLTHPAGRGERQSGQDVGAALMTHGSWQPSVQPLRRPTLADAVVGSMGGMAAGKAVLVDVGAGYGLLTLAAAARGNRVIAFELGPHSVEALEASVARNGFGHLVELQKLPLGGPRQEGYICLARKAAASGGGGGAATEAQTDMARGYASPAVHAVKAETCQLMAKRTPGASVVSSEEQVGAIRVSANGWEGWVLEGFAPLIERQLPPVIVLEWNPSAMRATGYNQPLKLLQWLHALGYTEASHSGYVCDERWYSITYGVRRRGGVSPEDLASLRQPTWCRLLPENWALLLERSGSTRYPETLLLVNRAAGNASSSGSGGDGSELGAAAQQGRHGPNGNISSQRKDGGTSEDAVLEANVAAALAALERAEHAMLSSKQQLQQQQHIRPATEHKSTAAADVAAQGDGHADASGRPSKAATGAELAANTGSQRQAAAEVSALAAEAGLAGEQQGFDTPGSQAAKQQQKQLGAGLKPPRDEHSQLKNEQDDQR